MVIPDSSATPDEMNAWSALLETTALVQQAADRRLRRTVGLTAMQFEVLARIAEAQDGGLRMTDIADRLVVSRSGLTYQVSQLEKRGLVLREPSVDDERAVIARITEEGMSRVADGIPHYVDTVKTLLLDRLRPQDLVTLADILSGVQAELRASTARAAR